MNKQSEFFRTPFILCGIEETVSPVDVCHRHTEPHDNRFAVIEKGRTSDGSAMQKFNSNM